MDPNLELVPLRELQGSFMAPIASEGFSLSTTTLPSTDRAQD